MSSGYFDWLTSYIGGTIQNGVDYSKTLYQLYKTPFFYILDADKNRIEDAYTLRDIYDGDASEYPDKCSVLELIIAVASRCQDVMFDGYDNPYTVKFWFWKMFENLELENMDDTHYDPYYVEHVTCRLISRDYEPDGRGGLFYISEPPEDMRNVQIWYQMNWYLDLYI